ncbi:MULTISPECIES: carboxymuconolactone decarboxylase family protein [unclassified Enterococcus]|uniref:carboxymuconolactone decarboxylase family protein n=1 Tax=unclassified Enterococcus TaxID=2608891 RepID=UPI001553A76F|nr:MULTISPECIES: carboxymuconolactone decarboxylase family protein [unclassified Enterococcus]MBS7576320.1 carboxymuconolactone decarboxylase family protein [Enterococcus sp. MMGLQ5-2]MBS7583553.1 carboxymuconolactone decarboxylase family protein [Enterococcus sp. MMGLQ5-1]NPD11415.1 carboxymuconolactone decarboxylase family protein [Enterococcus sp. MMGLQ5-1]NPD36158.1 carboxymuconolactone decarboxylase family protein [Enterococcus sp. MMGLQ5-2]
MKEKSRYQSGFEKLKEIDGQAGENVIESLAGMTEDIGKYILEFAFGDIYNRKGLDIRQRELITLASLISQGDTGPQLEVHFKASLNVGITQEEIVETLIQCIPYVGFPRVLNATFIAKKIFSNEQ